MYFALYPVNRLSELVKVQHGTATETVKHFIPDFSHSEP